MCYMGGRQGSGRACAGTMLINGQVKIETSAVALGRWFRLSCPSDDGQ